MVTVNLIPEKVQAAQFRRRHFKRWTACLIVTTGVATVPAVGHWMQHLRIDELRAQSDKLQTDLAAARAELKTATAVANDAYLRIERAKALRSKRSWSAMLAFIGTCLPKDCWLTSLATDPEVPSTAPLARKAAPPPAIPGTPLPEKPAVVILDTPRKLRMMGEATDATQPLSFVTRLKESQVFREVILERSINTSPHGSRAVGLTRENVEEKSNFRFELICEW